MTKFKKLFGPLLPVFYFFLISLGILSLSRLGLSIWQYERVSAINGWAELLLQGVRIDISMMCYFMALFVPLSLALLWDNNFGKKFKTVLCILFTCLTIFFIFMELSTPSFIDTFDFRPNRIFVEYLTNPIEVFSMLINGHLLGLVLAPLLTAGIGFCAYKFYRYSSKNIVLTNWKWRILQFVILAPLIFIGARSSFQHRGINPSMVAFASDSLINSMVLNSTYSVCYAIYQLGDEENAAKIYGKMSDEEIIATIKLNRGRPDTDYVSKELPTLTKNTATYTGKPKNIVIILEESFGARFNKTLGGDDLSPNFDALAKEGWLFDNLYCTGTRSVRGIEAVITGFTPTPARAVVKLSKSQSNFFTLASFLKQFDYQTSFIYGGEKHFDNMANFFYGNGFDLIIDQNDYKTMKYRTTWGASDEDLFDMADKKLTEFTAAQKPFFSLIFTSSNHDPFDVPLENVDERNPGKQTRENAIQYADYALGEFFKKAKASNYWKDTIFLIIADHDSRVAGDSLIPIQHFHIPALILGDGIEARRDSRLVSQIDMPTTLLSLAGTSGEYPMMGYDLTKPENPNRAIMQFDKLFAYRKGDEVVILAPKANARGFIYDKNNNNLIPSENVSDDLKKLALATVNYGSLFYKKGIYSLPKKEKEEK